MRLRSWCHIGVLLPSKLSLEIVHGDCAHSRTQLAATRFHSIITSDALAFMNLIVSCSTMMTAPKLAQIRLQVKRSWSF